MAAPYNAYITVSRKYLLYIGVKPKRAFTSRSCHILDVNIYIACAHSVTVRAADIVYKYL